jgi:ATP-dependent Clp protease ATP-binding subunit ClpX
LNTQVVGYGAHKKSEQIDKNNLLQYVLPDDLRKFGLIPEIVGRLPVLAYLNPLDRTALRRILIEPKNSIIKQYIKLFKMDNIKLSFTDDALDFIVDQAVNFKLGARGLRAICESIMLEAMFEMPSKKLEEFVVDKEYAQQKMNINSVLKFKNAG